MKHPEVERHFAWHHESSVCPPESVGLKMLLGTSPPEQSEPEPKLCQQGFCEEVALGDRDLDALLDTDEDGVVVPPAKCASSSRQMARWRNVRGRNQ